MNILKKEFATAQILALAGGVFGYVCGLLHALSSSFGMHESIGVAGHTVLAGYIAALIGYLLYFLLRKREKARVLVSFPVFVSAFLGLIGCMLPNSSFYLGNTMSPLSGMFAGAIGGLVGGITYIVIKSRQKSA